MKAITISSASARGERGKAQSLKLKAQGKEQAAKLQSERGLQAAEAWVLCGANDFPDWIFESPNGERRDGFGLFGTVVAGERFCGLKAALLSPSLHGYAPGSKFKPATSAVAMELGAWSFP
jgi:hypothetical protein